MAAAPRPVRILSRIFTRQKTSFDGLIAEAGQPKVDAQVEQMLVVLFSCW